MPKTLLLADDSVTIQKVVGISFANEDIVLLTVDNGDDAVQRAGEARPDIVLADVVMPGRSGYEVCEAIKADPNLAGTPVLLLTGTFEAFDEERAQRAGADGHITKPFEAQALVDQVNALLARGATVAPSASERPDEAELAAPVSPSADTAYDFFDDEVTEPGQEAEADAQTTLLGEPAPAYGPRSDEAFGFEEAGEDLASAPPSPAPRAAEEVSAARLFDDPAAGDLAEPLALEEPAPAEPPLQGETRILSAEPSDASAEIPHETPGEAHTVLTPPPGADPFAAPEPDEPSDPFAAPAPDAPHDPFAAPAPDEPHDPFAAPAPDAPSDPFAAPAPDEPSDPFAAPAPDAPHDPFAAPAPDAPSDPFAAPASADPFAAPAPDEPSDPFAAPPTEASDPFAAPASAEASDPFAAPASAEASDPFAAPASAEASDPFAAPASAEASDPFAAPASAEASDPFAAPAPDEASDPFAAPAPDEPSDPFAAPAPDEPSDPFAAPAPDEPSDPFAAPGHSGSDAFAAPEPREADPLSATPGPDDSIAPPAPDPVADLGDPLAFPAAPDEPAPAPHGGLGADPALDSEDPLAASAGAPPPRSEWDGALDDTGDGTVAFEFGGPLADVEPGDAVGEAVLAPPSGSDYDVSSSDLGSPLAPPPSAFAAPEPAESPSAGPPEAAASPELSPLVRQEVRDAIEKIAWEAFSQVTETLVKEALERVERIAWEVVPQMTEALIREEIRKLKGDDSGEE